MLEIKTLDLENFTNHYFDLLSDFYLKDNNSDYYISGLKKALNYSQQSEFQSTDFFFVLFSTIK